MSPAAPPRAPLYLSEFATPDVDYYLKYHRGFSRKYGEAFRKTFTLMPHPDPTSISYARENITKALLAHPHVCFYYAWYQDYEERILANLADSGAIKVLGSAKFPHAFALCATSSIYAQDGSLNPDAVNEAALNTYPTYRIGAAVPLTFTGEGFDAAGFTDWYPLTPDMRWTPDACPRIMFRLGNEEGLGEEAVFRLTYTGSERIEVLINEAPVGSLAFTGSDDETKELRFRTNLLKRGGLNIIRMKVSGPFTEKDDVRYLSMAFKAFAVVPVK